MLNGKSNKNKHKNIRQAYDELEKRYDALADAHTLLQRTLKLLITERKRTVFANEPLSYSYDTARYFTAKELDEMEIEVVDNKEDERIELRI